MAATTTTRLRASTSKANRELVADLQRIGFSEYEARTYMSLLQVNPATAYEVSKHSGLPRANTYGALDALTQKNAVQPVTESPVRYAPVRPEVLLDRLSSELNGVCDRLKDHLGALETDDRSDIVWSLSGQEQIERKINELIDGAKGHVWIKASTSVLRQHLEALQRAARRDVSLVFVVFGQDTEFLELGTRSKVYLHEGNGVRIGGADNLFTVAIDYRVALTANVTGELTGAYTTNPSVVRMAEIMMAFPEQIGQRFGPNLVRLRQQMFSAEQLQTLRDNVKALPASGPSRLAAASAKPATRPAAKVAAQPGEPARATRAAGTRGDRAAARTRSR
jgi:sugar-specific transcriptional regulator TrmB